jgi:hypothetical protein
MASDSRMHTRTLAQWLDQPIHTLKARWRRLQVPALAVLVVSLSMVLSAQVMSLAVSSPGAVPGIGQMVAALGVTLGLLPVLMVLAELFSAAGLLEVEEGRTPTFSSLIKRTLQANVILAVLARLLLHAVLLVLSTITCGLGLIVWLAVIMYLPLVVPVAMREGLGGAAAVRRSIQLTWWRPTGGPTMGSADRVVIAYHVVVGLTYAVNALPSLPTLVWNGLALWGMVADGTLDGSMLQSGALQAQLTPPIWLVLPVQLVTSVMALSVTFYTQQLFLDLHRDLVDAREGSDFDRALDQLEGSPGGG